jgi:hypothetical protein
MNLSREDRIKLDGCIKRIVQKGQYDQEELLAEIRDLIDVRIQEQGE